MTCHDCGNDRAGDLTRCPPCNQRKNEAQQVRIAAKYTRGECKDCPAYSGGYTLCPECRRKKNEARQAARFAREGHVKPTRPGSNLVRGLRA